MFERREKSMRKPLQTSAMLMALVLSGNAVAHPNIESCCIRESGSGENPASSSRAIVTGDDRNVETQDAALPGDSFRPTERVAPGRLDKSVGKVSTAPEGLAISNRDDGRGDIETGRPALHPATPDTVTSLPTAFAAPHVVLDGTPVLTGSWLSNGQYVLTFGLNARN
ncbi:hypothetical protein C2L65_07835 [Paraburkholderia terrae]|uniref:Uncharacterized protein n=2 Tax=Paraburkholderia terrae TaxID=311230 RepID=A0A2I8EJC8_9BURK|nr:hypothetical protein C2L65_07835 [Paraburkholderia terrae]